MPSSEKQERIQGQGGATPGPWRWRTGLGTGIDDYAALVSDAVGGPIIQTSHDVDPEFPDAKLIAAAPDHALLLAAITARQAGMRDRRMYPGQGDAVFVGKAAAYPVELDAFGCPILTEELRAALRKAGREP